MKDKNEYGYYSSGYIYDRLNRNAMLTLKKQFPELKDKEIQTIESRTFFEKRLCGLEKTKVFTSDAKIVGNQSYYVENALRKHSMLIAGGYFYFKIGG